MNKSTGIFLSFFILISIVSCSQQVIQNDIRSASSPDNEHPLPGVKFCRVPNSEVPSSAFEMTQSASKDYSGYWVNYQCKQSCEDWKQCLVPAYSDDNGGLIPDGRHPESSKQALAFVIDGMAGHLALSNDGNKTVLIHTGAGGTRYYIKPADTLEKMSTAKTVMIRWEKGYTSPIVQAPFTKPITWGWYSRTSAEATNIKDLNKRVASIIAWSHDNLSNSTMFGTLGCSMGTNATFGPVLWHGLDPIIDYQVFVGGPNMWDLNAQCARRTYSKGYCDLDGVSQCSNDDDCVVVDKTSRCLKPGPYKTIDLLFNQLPNHIHASNACDIRASNQTTLPYAPFDDSSMAFASAADWEIDHQMDFLINIGKEQGANFAEGIGGDEYWGLGHFPYIFNKVKPDVNKHWHAVPNSHHCDGMYGEGLDLIKQGMQL